MNILNIYDSSSDDDADSSQFINKNDYLTTPDKSPRPTNLKSKSFSTCSTLELPSNDTQEIEKTIKKQSLPSTKLNPSLNKIVQLPKKENHRIRTYSHVDGQWSLHIYSPVYPVDHLSKILNPDHEDKILNMEKSEKNEEENMKSMKNDHNIYERPIYGSKNTNKNTLPVELTSLISQIHLSSSKFINNLVSSKSNYLNTDLYNFYDSKNPILYDPRDLHISLSRNQPTTYDKIDTIVSELTQTLTCVNLSLLKSDPSLFESNENINTISKTKKFTHSPSTTYRNIQFYKIIDEEGNIQSDSATLLHTLTLKGVISDVNVNVESSTPLSHIQPDHGTSSRMLNYTEGNRGIYGQAQSIQCFTNDERTSLFYTVKVDSSPNTETSSFPSIFSTWYLQTINQINTVLKSQMLQPYYNNPKPHVSLASAPIYLFQHKQTCDKSTNTASTNIHCDKSSKTNLSKLDVVNSLLSSKNKKLKTPKDDLVNKKKIIFPSLLNPKDICNIASVPTSSFIIFDPSHKSTSSTVINQVPTDPQYTNPLETNPPNIDLLDADSLALFRGSCIKSTDEHVGLVLDLHPNRLPLHSSTTTREHIRDNTDSLTHTSYVNNNEVKTTGLEWTFSLNYIFFKCGNKYHIFNIGY